MFNNVTLIGYLGSDAESRTTNNDSTLTSFSLATKRSWKNRETGAWESQTTWHRWVCFGAVASWASSLRKGDDVQIVGEIQNRDYVAKDGVKKTVTEIRVQPSLAWIVPPKRQSLPQRPPTKAAPAE